MHAFAKTAASRAHILLYHNMIKQEYRRSAARPRWQQLTRIAARRQLVLLADEVRRDISSAPRPAQALHAYAPSVCPM